MLLYIIRHGDPVYPTDSLTEKGAKQADALAQRLAVNGLDEVYSSPMGRARLTAQPACDLLGLECKTENWMSESLAYRDFSIINEDGKKNWAFHGSKTKFKTDPAMSSGKEWHESEHLSTTNAKEGYKRIQEHSDEFLERLGYRREGGVYKIIRNNEDRVGAFCHNGFGVIWMSYLLAMPPYMFWSNFEFSHSGITILEFKNYPDGYTAPLCLCFSDLSHIYKSGLPLQHNNSTDI